MEFEQRKAAALAAMNSPEPDKSPKGTIDAPIIPLLSALNSHPSYFTTSSCSGRISIFSQPIAGTAASKKKAKGGTWLFISHDPVEPTSVLPLLFPLPLESPAQVTAESDTELTQFHPPTGAGSNGLVFRFEPLIIAMECRDVEAAQSLVYLAISCGFRESGITSASKRVIIAIRCSIRMEVPLGDTGKIMVSPEYVKYLVEVANEKMETNRKRTDNFLDALLKNGFSRSGNDVEEVVNGGVSRDEGLDFGNAGKLESLGNSSTNVGDDNHVEGKRRNLDNQCGLSQVPGMNLSMSPILVVGESAERLFLWGHSACTLGDRDNKKVLIFGGFGGPGRHARRNDLLLLDPEGWKIEAINLQEAPSPRLGHTATIVGDCMYVIGGRADPLNILNEVWVFREGTKEWSLLQCSGSQFYPRHRHSAAVMGSEIYVFGGICDDVILSSLYVFDTQTLEWSDICIQGEWPSPRHSHSMLAHGSDLYMFGGYNNEKALGDLYMFNVKTCKWKKLKTAGRRPAARFSPSMFIYNNYLGVLGGCPVSPHHQELSLLDLQSYLWKHITVNSVGSDLFVRSTANVVGDELIMIGGGAACYAFGTKFSEPMKINLLPLLSLRDNSLSAKIGEMEIRHHENGSIDNKNNAYQNSQSELNLIANGSLADNGDDVHSDVKDACQMASSYWVLQLERKYAKLGKDILKRHGWLDLERKAYSQDGIHICFPVLGGFCTLFNDKRNSLNTVSQDSRHPAQSFCPDGLLLIDISESAALDILMACGANPITDEVVKVKKSPISPLEVMKEAVSSLIQHRDLPSYLLEQLPSRWEQLGDIVVLPISSFKDAGWDLIGEELWPIVAKSLGAHRLARQGKIAPTKTRDSTLEILVGDNGWVEHRENGILYSFDATKCMFSWGNLSEKLRMARLDCRDQVIVDLFAGIGYFTLPFLVRGYAKLVYACEWNPHAVEALHRNLHANSVADRCIILEGDNRVTAPKGVADRVCLGLLPSGEGSWVTAVRALRSDGGILHIHGNVKDSEESSWTDYVSRSIHDIAGSEGYFWDVSLIHVERVKWYAPHIRHLVADVRCSRVQNSIDQNASRE